MRNGGWYAFKSDFAGRSYVKHEPSGTAANNEATITGATLLGPFASQQTAQRALAIPVKGKKGKKPKKKDISGAYIVTLARSWLGVPYLYGGTTRSGVDCSGLVLNVAQQAGIQDCPRTSEEQWAWCQHINEKDVGAGDLVFFVGAEIDPPPGHVSIVVHPGLVISADTTGTAVRYDRYDPNAGGIARVIGYGRMHGVSFARSANYATAGRQQISGGGAIAAAAAEPIGGLIATGVVFLFAVAALVLLVLLALWFKGM